VYGHTGSGKTHFIGTAAKSLEFGRILLLCPDPGALTLAFDDDANQNIEIASISSMDDFDAWYEYLSVENPKSNEFQTVAIDGFTDISELALQEALRVVHENDSNRDPDQPAIDHWNRVGIAVRRVIRQFRDLPLTFIATALAQDKQDSMQQTFVLPSVAGKLAAELGAYVDIIGYLYTEIDKETKDVHRKLRVQRTEKIQAKDRTRRLPPIIHEPTLPGILDMIRNNPIQVAVPAADPKFIAKKPDLSKKK
jgi:phage nucleotide-binding protein